MRQTSRAVALLLTLESANAALVPVVVTTINAASMIDYTTQFNTVLPDNTLTSHSAAYVKNLKTDTSWGTITQNASVKGGADAGTAV